MPNLILDFRLLPFFGTVDPTAVMHGSYRIDLVLLSLAVAALGSYVALSVAGRVRGTLLKSTRVIWISAGALAMGGGIWGMHFIGMLAFSMGHDPAYDFVGTVLSITPGILASALAITILSRESEVGRGRLLVVAVLIGAGIGSMHYAGMAAMRHSMLIFYDARLVALSVVVAVALAYVAVTVQRFKLLPWAVPNRLLVSTIMGGAVAGMHYTAMEAAIFLPLSDQIWFTSDMPAWALATLIGGSTMLVASLVLVASFAGSQKELAAKLVATEIAANREKLQMLETESFNASILRLIANGAPLDEILMAVRDAVENRVVGTTCSIDLEGVDARSEPRIQGAGDTQMLKQIIGAESKRLGTVLIRFPSSHKMTPSDRGFAEHAGHLAGIAIERDEARSNLLAATDRAEAAQRKAELASNAKTQFLGRMSHELRTPLSAIVGLTELLKDVDDSTTVGEERECIAAMAESSAHLMGVLGNILDLVDIEEGSVKVLLESIDINACISECFAQMKPSAQEGGITLDFTRIDYPPMRVRADRNRLKQVILNVLSNAIKFTKSGGSVRVAVDRAGGGRARVLVTDTGVGIANEEIPGLCEPFRQLQKKYEADGTGIGLSLAKSLMDRMNGSIGVASEVGKGSTFWVELDQAGLTAPSVRVQRRKAG